MIDTTFLAVSSLMLLAGYTWMGRGNLIRVRQQVHKAWAILEQPLRQRDTALNELEALRGQGLDGDAIARSVTARAALCKAFQEFDAAAFDRGEVTLRDALDRLLGATVLPDTQASDTQLRRLAERIRTLDGKITERGRVYNSAVDFHNMQIRQFPYLLLAYFMGFRAFERLDSAIWKTTAAAATAA